MTKLFVRVCKKQATCCSQCRKPLPRCSLCLLHLATSAGSVNPVRLKAPPGFVVIFMPWPPIGSSRGIMFSGCHCPWVRPSFRVCIRVGVLFARYLTNQWLEFHWWCSSGYRCSVRFWRSRSVTMPHHLGNGNWRLRSLRCVLNTMLSGGDGAILKNSTFWKTIKQQSLTQNFLTKFFFHQVEISWSATARASSGL